MLTKGDVIVLRRAGSRAAKVARMTVVVVSCVLLLAAVAKLFLLSRLAGSLGIDVWSLVVRSVDGVDVNGFYPGWSVLARDFVVLAGVEFGMAAAAGTMAWGMFRTQSRDQRILAELQRVGVVVNPTDGVADTSASQ